MLWKRLRQGCGPAAVCITWAQERADALAFLMPAKFRRHSVNHQSAFRALLLEARRRFLSAWKAQKTVPKMAPSHCWSVALERMMRSAESLPAAALLSS